MDLKDAYLEVAERSLESAKAALTVNVQEATGFYSYHAFESLGGALCASTGDNYPNTHAGKMNQFVAVANRGPFRPTIGRDVSVVAMLVSSLRNKCLYPEAQTGGRVRLPNQVLSLSDAQALAKRVAGVKRRVAKHL